MKSEPIVMFDSDEAAKRATVEGWVSRHGRFYGDSERSARYDGCTHRACDDCGAPVEKGWIKCRDCRTKADIARWEAMPKKPWDGVQMIFCDANDCYFSSPEEILELCEDEGWGSDALASLRPILCDPHYAREVDAEYWCDELPEDGELPPVLEAALDTFNKAVRAYKQPLSWFPGKVALDVSAYSEKGKPDAP